MDFAERITMERRKRLWEFRFWECAGLTALFVCSVAKAAETKQDPPFAKQQDQFSKEQTRAILKYWKAPDRYIAEVPTDWLKTGLWQVRLTVEGSKWLWNYNKARGLGKFGTNPIASIAKVKPEDAAEWEAWIDAKVAWDRSLALEEAIRLNLTVIPNYRGPFVPLIAEPVEPPNGLIDLVGNPPTFAEVVVPLQHTIRFEDGAEIRYQDNPRMPVRYAYYRFEKGVMSGGVKVRTLPDRTLDKLFREAGVDDSDRNIMAAVSLLEGGFDSVNTYDTGFVSVGLIQFASLKDGAGSLGRLMKRLKASAPDDFAEYFSKFGIEVSEDAKLAVLDIETGVELVGAEANSKIIEDKRLTAVFQHAGLRSEAFQMEQIRSAYADYYPGNDGVELTLGGRQLKMKVSDFIRSEAGMATLMDRKVNTGTLDPLAFVLITLAQEKGISSVNEFARIEREIIVRMIFRRDFLADKSLTQPK